MSLNCSLQCSETDSKPATVNVLQTASSNGKGNSGGSVGEVVEEAVAAVEEAVELLL
jgi:hypothetical protein